MEGVPHGFTDDMARDMCERIAGPVECMERGNGPFYQIRFVNQEGAGRSFAIHGENYCKYLMNSVATLSASGFPCWGFLMPKPLNLMFLKNFNLKYIVKFLSVIKFSFHERWVG